MYLISNMIKISDSFVKVFSKLMVVLINTFFDDTFKKIGVG